MKDFVGTSGYHAQCHTPAVDPEVDSDSWVCRQCVFAIATKVGFWIFVTLMQISIFVDVCELLLRL